MVAQSALEAQGTETHQIVMTIMIIIVQNPRAQHPIATVTIEDTKSIVTEISKNWDIWHQVELYITLAKILETAEIKCYQF